MKKGLLICLSFIIIHFSSFSQNITKRNCGTMSHLTEMLNNDPGLANRMNQIEQQTNQFIANRISSSNRISAVTITIPVVFHILYNTASQNISDAQCIAQLNQLNLDYSKRNSDTLNIPSAFKSLASNTNIQFCLAQRDPNGLATTGIIHKSTTSTSFTTDDKVKSSTTGGDNAWSSSSYLNIWVCNLSGGVLGYAQFPGGAASTDGVVLLYNSVGSNASPGNSTASPYNLGRTATHEVGHWLNLRHIWGDANCGDDLVGDTPTQQTSNYGCPTFPHKTCNNTTNGDMFMNYMDYVDDACMNMFSAGQVVRMNALFATGGQRVGLVTSLGCQTVSGSCSVPSGLTSSSITSSSASLSWTAVAGANSYTIRYRVVGDTTWLTISSSSNTIAINNLSASKNYEYQIQTLCTSGNSSFTNSSSFTTLAQTSACINAYESNETQASASTVAENVNISAGINSVTDIDYYKITTTVNSNFNITLTSVPADFDITLYNSAGSQIGSSSAAGTTNESITMTNQAAGIYYIKVLGYNGAYSTASCYTLFFGTTANATCGISSGLSTSNVTSNSVSLSWTAVSGANSYNIRYRVVGDSTWITTSSSSANTSLSNLTASKNYEFQVQTICTSGNSNFTASANFTTLTQTPSCSNAYETNETQANAASIAENLNISAGIGSASDIDYYTITTTANNNFNITLTTLPADFDIVLYNSAGTQIGSSSAAGTTNESIVLTNQAAGTYYIKITGYSGAFSSASCYTLYFGTSINNTCGLTSGLSTSSITSNSALLSWTAVSGANSYSIRYRVVGDTTWMTTSSATASVNLINLTAGKNYEFQVQTICTVGNSNFSASANFSTLNSSLNVPASPSSITITAISTTICGAKKYRYTAPILPAATSTNAAATGYIWSFIGNLGTNAIIDSGTVNSRIITATFTNNAAASAGDSVKLLYTSSVGNSLPTSRILTNTLLTAPSSPLSITITALSTDICGSKRYRYSAPALNTATTTSMAATGYLWSFTGSLGATAVIDSGSTTSRIITVKYTSNSAAITGDSVRVLFTSGCGNSPNRSSKLTNTLLSAPTAPSSITITAISTNVCNAKKYRYTAPALSAATSTTMAATGYLWSFTGSLGANAFIDSGTTSSRTITVTFSNNSAAVSGDSVRVLFTSGCGNSSNKASILSNTNLSLTTAPSMINSTLVKDSCGNRIYRFTAPALSAATTTQPAATGYLWSFIGSLYATATIDSGSLNSKVIRIKFSNNAAAATGDSARVAYTSACGNSLFRSMKLTNVLKACRLGATNLSFTMVDDNVKKTGNLIQFNVFPNPSTKDFYLNFSSENNNEIEVDIIDVRGRLIKSFTSAPNRIINFGTELTSGMYFLIIKSGKETIKRKLIKL